MAKYIYGAEIILDKLTIEKYPIAKETKKTITTERGCSCLGYRRHHRKNYHQIYRTPEEAVNALVEHYKNLIAGSQRRIEDWQDKLSAIEHLREQALNETV